MKKLIFAIILLSFAFFIISCQKDKWKGSIEEVKGVTFVKNPNEPIYKKDVFMLEEELSIGEAKGREEYMFQQIRSMAVDEQENIYVLDRKAALIKVFDKKGKYIQTIGEKGQGPGEFIRPGQIFISAANELWVYDDGHRSFSIFTLDGKYIKSLNTSRVEGLEARIGSKGNITFCTMDYSQATGYISYSLDLYDKGVNFIKRLATIPGTSSERGYNLFPSFFSWKIDNNDNIVYGYQEEYRLQVFNTNGELIKVITKEHMPIRITKAEIDRRKAGFQDGRKVYIPKYHPIFNDISIDEEGRIFVMLRPEAELLEGNFHDIFDSTGRYLAKVHLMGHPYVWKNGKLYTVESDNLGYLYVKRYKVFWRF